MWLVLNVWDKIATQVYHFMLKTMSIGGGPVRYTSSHYYCYYHYYSFYKQ